MASPLTDAVNKKKATDKSLKEQAQELANRTGNEVRIQNGQLTEVKSAANIANEASRNVSQDLKGGESFARSIIGSGLSRLGDNADNKLINSRLRDNLDGNSQAANLRRSQGVQGIAGQERAAQRGLASSLGRSGVTGGAAAAAQLEIAQAGLNANRQFQESQVINEQARERQAIQDFANFSTTTTQFDIGQQQKEKALDIQARLGYTNLLSTERNSIRQQEAANLLAMQESEGGGKK